MTAPGRTPYERIVAASATCMVNRVGWIRSIPVTVSGADIASVTENPGFPGDQRLRLRDGRGEHRFGREQVSAHRGPLRTLPGEHPYRASVVLPDRGLIRNVAVGDLAQTLGQLCEVLGHHGRAHRPVRTPARQGVGQIRQRQSCRSPGCSTQSASRPAVWRSASAEVDDSGNSSGPAMAGPAVTASCAVVSGACSSTACTFVPDIPYDDTAARRGVIAVRGPRCDLLRHKEFGLDLGKVIGQAG